MVRRDDANLPYLLRRLSLHDGEVERLAAHFHRAATISREVLQLVIVDRFVLVAGHVTFEGHLSFPG